MSKSTVERYDLKSVPITGNRNKICFTILKNLIRERGIPERINQTALGAMMARGPLHDGIVLLFRGLALRPNLVG